MYKNLKKAMPVHGISSYSKSGVFIVKLASSAAHGLSEGVKK
jgi:hypothetical protein